MIDFPVVFPYYLALIGNKKGHTCLSAIANRRLMSMWFLVCSLNYQKDMNMKTSPYMDFSLTLVLV